MNPLPSLAAASFVPRNSRGLDFDAVAAPRVLRPRPVEAGADTAEALRVTLSWFWNSNPEWAGRQIAVADRYSDLVRVLVRSVGLEGDARVVLPAAEPRHRRRAWSEALPAGIEVVDWRPGPCGRLLLDDLEGLLDERTRLVVLTKACPITGSLNEVIPFAQRLAGTGVALVVEASHFVAHGPLDIRNLRCDGVIVEADELFGARGAVLWSRRLGGVSADEASAAGRIAPATAALLARALGYVERLGAAPGGPAAPPSERFGRREPMRNGMQAIRQEERVLSRRMLAGLSGIAGISVLGEGDPLRAACRTPAFTFTSDRAPAADLGAGLARAGVEVASGDLGAREALEALGMDSDAGVLRASLAHYHTAEDIESFLNALRSVASARARLA